MSENTNNPLGLKDKLYTIEEFASEIRSQFGADDYVSDIFLDLVCIYFLVRLTYGHDVNRPNL